jgi:ankyrin repeat protein
MALLEAIGRHLDCYELSTLLNNGADVNARDDNGDTALILATSEMNWEELHWLIQHGGDFNAFVKVTNEMRRRVVHLLLEHGADVNARGNNGNTALIQASIYGHAEAVLLLLERGAHVNALNNTGQTPLIAASEFGHTDVVRLLLELGADVNARNCEGMTALIRAALRGHTVVVRLLIEARRRNAARMIQSRWRFIIADPNHPVCKRRLLREFAECITS